MLCVDGEPEKNPIVDETLNPGDTDMTTQLTKVKSSDLDDLEVWVEVDETLVSDVMGDVVRSQRKVAERIHAELGLRAWVTLVEPGADERTAGTTQRVLDLRAGQS